MADIIPDRSNEKFNLALDLVNQSSRNIFLTGKAGTGKTTFLKYVREHCPKQIAVVAPTGVAAINAGGMTIHSFFQLPLSPFIPESRGPVTKTAVNAETVNRHSLLSRLRMNDEKRKVLVELELLVIDEISMVRCDILDAIDTVLRYIRHRPLDPFGGVQVLFIGDMRQLPPVIRDQEWALLSPFYQGPYFFNSKVIQDHPPEYIEFDKIYRQSEAGFIQLLNQVRNNEMDEYGRDLLEERFQPSFHRSKDDGYIILTTHNDKARAINTRELSGLEGKEYSYQASIENDFPDKAYPADEVLTVKEGAQVMFIRNDMDKSRRYFNGKIGTVVKLEEDKIIIRCKDETTDIEVKKEKWENIRYAVNPTTRGLEEELLGSFTQFPIRLAWAITIHKSQGLTFEKAIIDAGEAFAPGQVYVALSRCTNLEGMILQSRVKPSSFIADERIIQFSESCARSGPSEMEWEIIRKKYKLSILLALFDLGNAIAQSDRLKEYVREHRSSFNEACFNWIGELGDRLKKLQETSKIFQAELQAIFDKPGKAEDHGSMARIQAAAGYYIPAFDQLIQYILGSRSLTDSRGHAIKYNESLREIFIGITLKKFLLTGNLEKFDTETYHAKKKTFKTTPFAVNAYSGNSSQHKESPHPELYGQLKKLRDSICNAGNIPVYLVAGTRSLDEMTTYLPMTTGDLEKVSGFGKARVAKYGHQFLALINEYCQQNDLATGIDRKPPKRQRKENRGSRVDTKSESYKLYRQGTSIAEIAGSRKLTIQTIEGHLSHYVRNGSLPIEELMSAAKLASIEKAIQSFDGGSIIPIKEQLGDDVSYGEIRLAIAWHEYMSIHRNNHDLSI